MAKDEEDDLLPDKDAAKGFYAKYEPKEVLGRYVLRLILCRQVSGVTCRANRNQSNDVD